MTTTTTNERSWGSKILWAAALYFVVCGLSAILYPISWLFVAGLPLTLTNELRLAFSVAGTFMVSLGIAGVIAAINPPKQTGLIATLMISNFIDFLVTLRAVTLEQLPLVRGALFLAVALTWTLLLALVLFAPSKLRG
jgi:hypothetical protein